MWPSLLFVFPLLAAQVVFSKNDPFRFTFGEIKQCKPVFLNFSGVFNGQDSTGIPTSIKVVPLNSTMSMTIPLPAVNTTDSGVTVSFLPIKAGSSIVATLNDKDEQNVSKVSDVTPVEDSDDASCLQPVNPTPAFIFPGASDPLQVPKQCENFLVKYNRNANVGAPKVTAFSPRNGAYQLNLTTDDGQGNAQYNMFGLRGGQLALLFESNNISATSPLFTIGGDATSSNACFQGGFDPNTAKSQSQNPGSGQSATGFADKSAGLSPKTVIGIAVAGGVVAVIAIIMVVYLLWERRRRRRVSIRFDPSLMEKLPELSTKGTTSGAGLDAGGQRDSFVSEYSYAGAGYVKNPPYARSSAGFGRRDSVLSGTTTDYMGRHTSIGSWGQAVPSDQVHSSKNIPKLNTGASSASSVQSFDDIERILNSQEQQHEGSILDNRASFQPLPPRAVGMPSPVLGSAVDEAEIGIVTTAVRTIPSRGHLRNPSDIPRSTPGSASVSRSQSNSSTASSSNMSGNPFNDSNSMVTPLPPIRPGSPLGMKNGGIGEAPLSNLKAPSKSHFSAMTTATTSSFGGGPDPDTLPPRPNALTQFAEMNAGRDSSNLRFAATSPQLPSARLPYTIDTGVPTSMISTPGANKNKFPVSASASSIGGELTPGLVADFPHPPLPSSDGAGRGRGPAGAVMGPR